MKRVLTGRVINKTNVKKSVPKNNTINMLDVLNNIKIDKNAKKLVKMLFSNNKKNNNNKK